MHYQKSKFLSETTKLDSILEREKLIKLYLLYFINNFFNKRLKDFIKYLLRVKYITYLTKKNITRRYNSCRLYMARHDR